MKLRTGQLPVLSKGCDIHSLWTFLWLRVLNMRLSAGFPPLLRLSGFPMSCAGMAALGLALLPALGADAQVPTAQPPAPHTTTAEPMVAQGGNQWGHYAPPLQARNAGQLMQGTRAAQTSQAPTQAPMTMGAGPHTSPLTSGTPASAGANWQTVTSPASSPRSRPADLPATSMATTANDAARDGQAAVDPQLADGPVPRLARPLPAPEAQRIAPMRRQADGRSQEFRRRWLIGNFY